MDLFSLHSTIHMILEVLAHLKKRKLLRRNFYQFACFWVLPGIPTVFLNGKGTKSQDFNSIPLCQRIGHFIEKQVYDRLSFRFGQVV
jgi:hypothetical protein